MMGLASSCQHGHLLLRQQLVHWQSELHNLLELADEAAGLGKALCMHDTV